MSAVIYSTTINIHITREQARDFVLENPEDFVDFILASDSGMMIDYLKCNPVPLNQFILDGGLNREED